MKYAGEFARVFFMLIIHTKDTITRIMSRS